MSKRRRPRMLWAVLDPRDGNSLDTAFSSRRAAEEHCRDTWPGTSSTIVAFVPSTYHEPVTYMSLPVAMDGR